MDAHDFGDLLADGEHGIERGHRLLEDHRDLLAADLPELAVGEVEQVLAVEQNLAAGLDAPRRADEPQNGEGGDRLPAAALADDAERLAGHHVERDAIDGARDTGARVEVRAQLANGKDGVGHSRQAKG